MLSVIILVEIILSVIMLVVIMLIVIILVTIILNVIMLVDIIMEIRKLRTKKSFITLGPGGSLLKFSETTEPRNVY
jgi:hypothetical protein